MQAAMQLAISPCISNIVKLITQFYNEIEVSLVISLPTNSMPPFLPEAEVVYL
jgi:hypothetical protein